MHDRPNPDRLLKRVQEEEQQQKHGKLKIYLGAAPGVGKTYSMLEDALEQREQGLDVVIGIVETHGRNEVASLLTHYEVLPRLDVEYRNQHLTELDLDGVLKRNPALVLIDEMAHTNAPGLRHAKRWQDIKEILDRGINVYTTLNVQHIESLNDVVAQIIHIPVRETVPDSMLELADAIELVDLPPEDLLKRLQEGKVYLPQQAELAKEHFFRKGNLSALRELALRVTAKRVGAQMLHYRHGQGISHIWPTRERILVCVGSRSESTKLIRAARRMAVSLDAEWMVVHVEQPERIKSEDHRNEVIQNLRLAEELGAETRILVGEDIVKEVMEFAREQNVTMIMVWKHIRPRWKDWFIRSLADEVVRHSQEIDVYIVTGEQTPKPFKPLNFEYKAPVLLYGAAAGVVALATLFDVLIYPYVHSSNLIMVYLLGVTVISLWGYKGPGIVASFLSVMAYGYFFISPFYSLDIQDPGNVITLIVMLLVSQAINHLTVRTQREVKSAQLAERYTFALHKLSRKLASTRGTDKLLEVGIRYIADVFDSDVIALLPENNKLMVRAKYNTNEFLSTKEMGIAQWVCDLGQVAGFGTDTLPFSEALYIPLLASETNIGVLRIHPHQPEQLLIPEQKHLLEACANQIALAIEVDRLQVAKMTGQI